MGKRWPLFMILLVMSPLLLWQGNKLRRPARLPLSEPWYPGVVYERQLRDEPRPLVIHAVRVDLRDPDIRVLVTPGEPTGGRQLPARTTTTFLDEFDLQVAMNGGFFSPSFTRSPWDYYPKSGDPIDALGQAISNGEPYSSPRRGWPVLCVHAGGNLGIQTDPCPPDAAQGIAGNVIFLTDGQPADLRTGRYPGARNFFQRHPRSAVALDASGETLWLIVVDGRQPGYSEGVTMPELAAIVRDLGATMALNLDGGGSSALARAGIFGAQLLNSPVHTAIPLRERPVANHIGIYVHGP